MPSPTDRHTTVTQRAETSARFVATGILLNLVLGVAKLAGGILGHSYALVADAAESLLDTLSSLLVWAGFRVAAKPPDADHPYGHGKASAVAGLFVAGTVFVAAAAIAWESVHAIVTPHQGPHWLTLPLLAIVVALKEFFSRRMLRLDAQYGATALKAEAWHHRSDALTSGAAFIGIAIGVIGGKGYEAADDWAALAACALITYNGVGIARAALGEIMDTAVPWETETEIRRLAGVVPGVRYVEKCRVLRSGLSLLVDIHVHVDGTQSVREGHEIAHAVKDALMAAPLAITDVAVHIEPARM
ncbi:cation diffusion facilitator family transporter [Opitutus sp. GAS368]|uniref:cation diffusion facilitator family transporter n=1 Tax=Opitutus sp. GAS368 TaxID=1882749 RepID=UPI00087C1D7D|nr:cation diffusion facilitator family transporter [Opitutus sp. GAS368]SDR91023.1 cation diffusion facilitator family transporter [Opitutus sp. GAS368]